MDNIAHSLQLDVEAVKRANLYQKDQVCQFYFPWFLREDFSELFRSLQLV